jgi:xanthine dehydrogenase accessory factor
MEALIAPLLALYERERRAGRAVALAVVAHTEGSTYRKPGALMLIAADGAYAGLLSGGCLESDLHEHALQVMASGKAKLITYDTRGSDDLLWGLGIGCEASCRSCCCGWARRMTGSPWTCSSAPTSATSAWRRQW